ncbi:medium-chain acyl-[acyl-carrier-protein] hydrolase [Sulfobacillus thermosulfidooxidans DSM 9293]|uniref:Medium-chain acyl-[acyl-carrier-protein] hydrolase n=1 Tax=Sulfobacillus thermosulfidooxidans (strain DSM 9293 / VKM B-1269 / AT-1) TaxID=929705 RepID=A0A1W1WNW9_SULTA|nr:thioesterase domain-containing protein [Sulfobacillus thermosulfidooxidans]SMC07889.1 medium-chain acyl-[acyl-carrier-protein] hydrolase [Sulfobacillus thermosulfidooxidans DSM 9293]
MNNILLFSRKKAKARLLCFPHAGAGAISIKPLADNLPDWIEVASIRLPGRESRFNEPLLTRFSEFRDDALSSILELQTDKTPLFLLGQCSGATLAYGVAKSLVALPGTAVLGLIVVSSSNPTFLRHQMSGVNLRDLAEEAMNTGIPKEILDVTEFSNIILEQMEADYRLVFNTVSEVSSNPAPFPILEFRAVDDRLESPSRWEGFSTNWETAVIPGKHLLIQENPRDLATLTLRFIERLSDPQTNI